MNPRMFTPDGRPLPFVTEGALQEAHLKELTRHHRLGLPVVAIRDGQVVELRAERTSAAWLIPPLHGWRSTRLKRAFDLAIAIPALVCAAPLIALLSVATAALSRGRPISTSERVGLGGGRIHVYQLASEGMNSWLARTRLDHLPELWNVVRGDLSIVGPRALRPEELDFRSAFGDRLTTIRPGIVGPSDVRAHDPTTFGRRVAIDDFYAVNWSIQYDWQILRAWLRRLIIR